MPYTEELYHYGVLGMKWGIRRYQNYDGSLTEAGKKRIKESSSFLDLGYGAPKGKNNSRRTEVIDAYNKEQKDADRKYAKRVDKNGNPIPDRYDVPLEVRYNIRDKYLKAYAKATLEDFKLEPTESAVNFLENEYKRDHFINHLEDNGFRQDPTYKDYYSYKDSYGNKYTSRNEADITVSSDSYKHAEAVAKAVTYCRDNYPKLDVKFREAAAKQYNLSESDIRKMGSDGFGLMIHDDGSFEGSMRAPNGYHFYMSEYDPKTKKFKWVSEEG